MKLTKSDIKEMIRKELMEFTTTSGGATSRTNVIEYITIQTTGNATDFGDMTLAIGSRGGLANSTRGVFAGGYDAPSYSNVMDYVTIQTTGNATDFGDLSAAGYNVSGMAGD